MDKEQQPAPKTKESAGDVGVAKSERKAACKVVPSPIAAASRPA